jgi:hypothetical protein
MTTTAIALLLIVLAVTAAILGSLGVLGLGQDSRGLDTRPHSDELPNRPLFS